MILICYTKAMKTIQCQHCSAEYTAQTQAEILSLFHAHYMKEHEAVITNVDEAGKKVWMDTFADRWNEASENN